MTTRRIDNVLETSYNDSDVKRAHRECNVPDEDDSQSFSKAILDMVKKMKRGSCKRNNLRSRKIVKALRIEHEKRFGKDVAPIDTPMQKSIFDFLGE